MSENSVSILLKIINTHYFIIEIDVDVRNLLCQSLAASSDIFIVSDYELL